MTFRCLAVKLAAHQIESGRRSLGAIVSHHIGACLACQAEIARERQLMRGLARMAREVQSAPPGLGSIVYQSVPIGHEPRPPAPRWVMRATLASVSAGALGLAVVMGLRIRSATI